MKNIRMLIVGLIAGALLATAGTALAESVIERVTAIARPDYKVKVDGKDVELQNAPLAYNGTTYVPLREAGEILGYKVGFKSGTISLDQLDQNDEKDVDQVEPVAPVESEPVETPKSIEIDHSEWVSIRELQREHKIEYRVGLANDDPMSDKRLMTLIFEEKSESFLIPQVIVGGVQVRNENGNELIIQGGERYIKRSFAEAFLN